MLHRAGQVPEQTYIGLGIQYMRLDEYRDRHARWHRARHTCMGLVRRRAIVIDYLW